MLTPLASPIRRYSERMVTNDDRSCSRERISHSRTAVEAVEVGVIVAALMAEPPVLSGESFEQSGPLVRLGGGQPSQCVIQRLPMSGRVGICLILRSECADGVLHCRHHSCHAVVELLRVVSAALPPSEQLLHHAGRLGSALHVS